MKRKNKKIIEEDDFFKNEEELEDEEEKTFDPEERLAEDLKAFEDDLKRGKKKVIEEELEDEEEEIDFAEFEEEEENEEEKKDKIDERWLIKKRNDSLGGPLGRGHDDRTKPEEDEDWLNKDYEEGELAVDVYQDKDNIYVKSTIAGVNVEDIDISIHNDLLTIRGKREQADEIKNVDYFYQECYWGSFSRSIILPVEVKADKIEAYLKDGILTIVLPKVKKTKKPRIKVKEK